MIFNYLDLLPGVPHESVSRERLYEDTIVVCASASHRLARFKRVDIADLARERWALSSIQLLNVQRLQKAFHDRGLPPPQTAIEARSLQLRLQAIATSNLLGYLPRRILKRAASLGLKELPVPQVVWRRSVGVIYREGGYLSPAAKRFMDILRNNSCVMTTT